MFYCNEITNWKHFLLLNLLCNVWYWVLFNNIILIIAFRTCHIGIYSIDFYFTCKLYYNTIQNIYFDIIKPSSLFSDVLLIWKIVQLLSLPNTLLYLQSILQANFGYCLFDNLFIVSHFIFNIIRQLDHLQGILWAVTSLMTRFGSTCIC